MDSYNPHMARTQKHRIRGRELAGLGLILAAEILLAVGKGPESDYYFPVVWYGYILTLDGALERLTGDSIFARSPRIFWLMIPISAIFWWIFEAFDVAVNSWHYLGTQGFSGFGYVALASISFSTVLLAVWETAMCVRPLLKGSPRLSWKGSPRNTNDSLTLVLTMSSFVLGIASLILPILFPSFAFGLIWVSLFLLLDPVNHWLGRPSLLAQVRQGILGPALCFGAGALVCGFFWESWNYWAPVKWAYSVPYVSQWHLFEMPVPGYAGYIPFGLELYAMAVFVLWPLARLLKLEVDWVAFVETSPDWSEQVPTYASVSIERAANSGLS